MGEIRIPYGAKIIINDLINAGYKAYVVGGCVRDSILEREPKDWDICTSAKPQEVKDLFADKYDIFDTGIKYGTVTILGIDDVYEVTTFRTEKDYSDARHPDKVEYVSNIETDLKRRDFTMNAMAYNDKEGLIDFFGGDEDIKNDMIRCVGNPCERFSEDPLRVLRAIRFASVYGFDIEKDTLIAMYNCLLNDGLRSVSDERKHTELIKIISGDYALNVLKRYCSIIAAIIPELKPCIGFQQRSKYHIYDVYGHIIHAVSEYDGQDTNIKMALLLHDIGKPNCCTKDDDGTHFYGHSKISVELAQKAMLRLRFSNRDMNEILTLIQYHDADLEPTKPSVKRMLNKIGKKTFRKLLEVRRADIKAHSSVNKSEKLEKTDEIERIFDEILKEEACFKFKDLKINGHDLIEIGIPEGKTLGATLGFLLDAVINGVIKNEREELLEMAKKYSL